MKKAPDKCPFCESPILVHGGNPLKSSDGGFATYECKSVQDIIWSDAEFKRAAQSEVCRRREVIFLTRKLDEANNRIKQLKNAGNNLANIIGPPHEITWATEIEIAAREILKTRERLNQLLSENTGQPLSRIEVDTERDYYLTADEAKAYGLVDDVIAKRP